jgi:hypothetical protein
MNGDADLAQRRVSARQSAASWDARAARKRTQVRAGFQLVTWLMSDDQAGARRADVLATTSASHPALAGLRDMGRLLSSSARWRSSHDG